MSQDLMIHTWSYPMHPSLAGDPIFPSLILTETRRTAEREHCPAGVGLSTGDPIDWKVVLFVVTADALKAGAAGEQQVYLDAENLAFTTAGCIVCEEPYSERIAYRRCKGEPRGDGG